MQKIDQINNTYASAWRATLDGTAVSFRMSIGLVLFDDL